MKKKSESPAGGSSANGAGRKEPGVVQGRSAGSARRWVRAKRPILGFVLLFVILMGVYYAVTFLDVIEMRAIPAYMRFNAHASAAVLNVFGEEAHVRGSSITSDRFSVDIQHGCDAIDPSALFLAAVLAFPASFRSKLPGLLIGTLVIAMVNLIRIVSLFYTGIYFPRAFQAMHVDVWQPVFILLALTFWVTWAWWATRNLKPRSDVSTQEA